MGLDGSHHVGKAPVHFAPERVSTPTGTVDRIQHRAEAAAHLKPELTLIIDAHKAGDQRMR